MAIIQEAHHDVLQCKYVKSLADYNQMGMLNKTKMRNWLDTGKRMREKSQYLKPDVFVLGNWVDGSVSWDKSMFVFRRR